MIADSLRNHLRVATSPLHVQLDSSMSDFTNLAAYKDYVQKTHRFRSAVELALKGGDDTGWEVDPIGHLTALDLEDLGAEPLSQVGAPEWRWSRTARLGALYVLEGSSLGARLLLRRAAAIGMGVNHGARHLDHQSADHQRWRAFLVELEHIPADMHQEVLTAADDVFRFALSVYGENAYECA